MEKKYKISLWVFSLLFIATMATAVEVDIKPFKITISDSVWNSKNTDLSNNGITVEQDMAESYQQKLENEYNSNLESDFMNEVFRVEELCRENTDYCIAGANALRNVK